VAIGLAWGTATTVVAAAVGVAILPSARIERGAYYQHAWVVIEDARRSLDAFVAGKGRCPSSEQELVDQRYRKRLARDPWGQPLLYVCRTSDGARTETAIRSSGPDKILWTSDDLVNEGDR